MEAGELGTFDRMPAQPNEIVGAMIEHWNSGFDESFESMVDAVAVPRAICVGATQWISERG
jgi:hypothetical protein